MRCLIFLYLLAPVFGVQANVSIQVNQQHFNFAENPRLVEVLVKVAGDKQWYWPASTLYRLDSTQAESQRNKLIEQLKFMQLSLSKKNALQVTNLIEQIKHWTLADRVDIKIDYDVVQMNANSNPRFENGTYRLDLKIRPKTLGIFGLNTQSSVTNLTNNQCAHDYIQRLIPDLANKDFVYIIQPDGVSQKVGIAYWNKGCVDIMPGSQIYLPLPESQFFMENKLLNEQIVELAKNRIHK